MAAPLLASAGWRQGLVANLYAYQGIVAGFALTALPNHLAAQGAGTAELGAFAAAIGLPWIAQPLWGPVVDRFGGMRMGRRRFWVIAALFASLVSLSGLLWMGDARPGALFAIGAVLTLHSLCAALMDTAADAMIIDHAPADQLGAATASTRAGFVTGLAVGGVVFAWVLPQLGLAGASLLLLGAGLLATVMPLLVRENAGDAWLSWRAAPAGQGPPLGKLLTQLGRDIVRPAHVGLLLFCVAQDFFGAVFRWPLGVHLIQQVGWTAPSLSTAQGVIGLLAGTVGAWTVGRWTDRVGPPRALGRLLAASAVAHLAVGGVLALGGGWAGPVALSLSSITSALCFVALAPAVMHASRGAVAASRFALYMAALNLGDVLGAGAAGQAMAQLGLVPLALGVASGYAMLAGVAARMVRQIERDPKRFPSDSKI